MTLGQRIAQKRKELGLSQEGLGEQLGVSRQAIYKWESDAALPEIEKLVKLSREFELSVDWLLGEGDESRELTPDQLRVVEEIVGRYLAAQPPEKTVIPRQSAEQEAAGEGKPEKKRRRRWPWVLGAAAMIVVVSVAVSLFDRLDRIERSYQDMQMSISSINSDVNRQIYTITRQVEETLQRQNDLTAEQSVQVADTDYRANTVTLSARAMPRTYVEGMEAEFLLVSGGESFTVPGELGEDHAFTARTTVPLTDEIAVSVAFLAGEQRQTQVLEEFHSLYSDSFATIQIAGGLSRFTKSSEAANWTAVFSPVHVDCLDKYGDAAQVSSLRVGLFRDQKLVAWFTEEEQSGMEGYHVFRMEPDRIDRKCVVSGQRVA